TLSSTCRFAARDPPLLKPRVAGSNPAGGANVGERIQSAVLVAASSWPISSSSRGRSPPCRHGRTSTARRARHHEDDSQTGLVVPQRCSVSAARAAGVRSPYENRRTTGPCGSTAALNQRHGDQTMSPIEETANVAPSADQGPLAQVIATRGGRASPEAPLVIEHREALIYMLCQAAELEHLIMCQSLSAACSLRRGGGEGLSDDELAAVLRWRELFLPVPPQEMPPLALVHTLLSAIGAAPPLARPTLPHPAEHYPAGVQL